MTDKPVDRGVVAVWRWTGIFGGLIALASSGIPAFAHFQQGRGVVAVLLPVAVMLVTAIAVAWYPPARYRHLRYRVDEHGITVRDGVFWRTESSVTRARIQHVDVYQGPLQRHYGVATLKLFTAGTHFNKIELPGLAHADALALRDELQREGDGDAV